MLRPRSDQSHEGPFGAPRRSLAPARRRDGGGVDSPSVKVDLFPTDALMRALDEPGSLLDDLDRAGKNAAAAFDRDAGSTEHKLRAFTDVLVADPDVPRPTRKRLIRAMPA